MNIKQTKILRYKPFYDTQKSFNNDLVKDINQSEIVFETQLSTADTFKMKSKPKIAENIEKPSENLFSNNSQHTDKSSCGIHSILQRILKNEIFLRQPNKESYKFYRELYF